MGLDMYLNKKTYVKQWSHQKPEELFNVEVTKGGKSTSIKSQRVAYIIEEVGYWRKFNALHNWFVKHVQNGVDECQESYVSTEQLETLLETLKEVKNVLDTTPLNIEKLEELLPTSSGFFFGSTEYDDYYKEDVKDTIELLTDLLAEEDYADYYYQSSW